MNITGGESLSLFEAQEAADIVQDAADEDVNMIFGTVINPELQDEIVVTVIATGFEDKPSTQGRKANTGFGSSAPSSSAPEQQIQLKKSLLSRRIILHVTLKLQQSVRKRLRMMTFLALLEIEKKDVLEEQDVNLKKNTKFIKVIGS